MAASVAAMFAALALPAQADDSTAAIGIGALQFQHMPHVAMQREDLSLSPREVKVRYEMRNETDAPIRAHVAFPLPPLQLGGFAETTVQELGSVGLQQVVNFALSVDGRPVNAAMRVWATIDGKDVTAKLRHAGIDVRSAPLDGGRLSPGKFAALKQAGAIGDYGSPDWAVNIAYEWDQVFRPGVTVITHRYTPILGLSYEPDLTYGLGGDDPAICLDMARARRMLQEAKAARRGGMLWLAELQFVLRTAANWDGPIDTFHLIVRADPPYDSVDMCPGSFTLQRTGDRRIEATATKWHPDLDLTVLFSSEN